jgi:hypothetical protein
LRVDVAMPVKKPYILYNKGWVFSEIDFNHPLINYTFNFSRKKIKIESYE